MGEPLVICYGNVARGDDGVAHRVADLLERRGPSPTVVRAPLLDVSLAEEVAGASPVVLVDAERRETPPVRTVDVIPEPVDPTCAHGLTPGTLMGLVAALYGVTPSAHLVTVAAPEMGHSLELSETAETASAEAVSEIVRIVGSD